MTLRRKVSTGLFWEGGAALIGQGLSFLVSLLLARLLAPEYFGLISIATLAISSLVFFQELGFSAALVYRQDDIEAAANTAHWTIIASSVVLYIIGFILAPLVARFFRSPEVTPILRVLALTIVISSLSRVSYTLLFKDMAFKKKVLPELLASLAGSVTSLLLALAGWKVWALVSGELVNASFATILVYLFYPWRPKVQFVRSLFREMFGYGKHIAASQILIFGITNVDDMFVGRMLGQAALGQYGLAYKISNLPATNITRLVTRVTFPAFTLLQGDIARMRGAFFRVVRYGSLLSIPVAVVTVIFAHDFVYFVLNPSWAPAILPMQILAIYGLIRSISSNMGTIFQAGGKPQWLTSIAAWRFVTMMALLYPAIKWAGLVGVCVLSAVVAIVDFFIAAYLADKILKARMFTYAQMLTPIFIYAILAGTTGYLVQQWLLSIGLWDIATLVAAGLVVVLVYGALTWWRDQEVRQGVRQVMAQINR